MILSKQEILEMIKSEPPLVKDFIDLEIQLQPAGIDLTLRQVFNIKDKGQLDFTNDERIIPKREKLTFNSQGWVFLPPGEYLVQYNEIIQLPLNIAALGKPRSSLLRMGATVFSAVWDPGYKGRGFGLLVVFNKHGISLKKNSRILQLSFLKLSTKVREGYKGLYLGEGLLQR
ncbi:MAG: deoxyuridine 5'-triphosphate nucleotidohydrolase [Thermoprotei archaeon]|nr:MAG: deoxyuridine 5'-triphosphate nucleotidohydrolase [Thermoprotei archaeon]